MQHTLIQANISKHISLDEMEMACFTSLLEFRHLKRKEILLHEGEPCTTINFVTTGALRAFYRGIDGKESTMMFAIQDWWITDMHGFANKKPAMVCIEAISESTIAQLSKENLDTLFEKVPKFEKFFRIIMQNSYIREQLRIIQNLSLSAEERYDHFLQKYPVIARHVTQKQIASYLGITPEFLSRVRKNISKKPVS